VKKEKQKKGVTRPSSGKVLIDQSMKKPKPKDLCGAMYWWIFGLLFPTIPYTASPTHVMWQDTAAKVSHRFMHLCSTTNVLHSSVQLLTIHFDLIVVVPLSLRRSTGVIKKTCGAASIADSRFEITLNSPQLN